MHPVKFHLAQINIARLVAPLDHPMMADFVAQLDPVNAAADTTHGFVWRLKSEASGNSTDVRAFEDDLMLINMSVWESIEALEDYTYREMHKGVFQDRKKWFLPVDGPSFALWWIEAGVIPSIMEGKERLEMLARSGPTVEAFTFKKRFPEPEG
jgi:hypothetical protein